MGPTTGPNTGTYSDGISEGGSQRPLTVIFSYLTTPEFIAHS